MPCFSGGDQRSPDLFATAGRPATLESHHADTGAGSSEDAPAKHRRLPRELDTSFLHPSAWGFIFCPSLYAVVVVVVTMLIKHVHVVQC